MITKSWCHLTHFGKISSPVGRIPIAWPERGRSTFGPLPDEGQTPVEVCSEGDVRCALARRADQGHARTGAGERHAGVQSTAVGWDTGVGGEILLACSKDFWN